jgi:hypothetical protein
MYGDVALAQLAMVGLNGGATADRLPSSEIQAA